MWTLRNIGGVLLISNNNPDDIRYSHWGGFNTEIFTDKYVDTTFVKLPPVANDLLIGKHLTWEDNPVEIK